MNDKLGMKLVITVAVLTTVVFCCAAFNQMLATHNYFRLVRGLEPVTMFEYLF